MTISVSIVAYILAAYLAGSVNLAIAVSRMFRLGDLRQRGSGNPGATNLYRAAGLRAALPVLILDFAKAVLVIQGATLFSWGHLAPVMALPYVIGNLFPLFHGFRGGKGVAAIVGTFIAISPWVMLSGGGVFILVFAFWRRVSLGSICMIVSYPLWCLLFDESRAALVTAVLMIGVVTLTHRGNIARMLKGNEPKLERSK